MWRMERHVPRRGGGNSLKPSHNHGLHLILSRLAAFTLAEVLITLGIIGVVAAMTLPSLIANYKEKQTVVALKKFYTTLGQAVVRSQVDNEGDYSAENIISAFKTVKICAKGDTSASCAPETYRTLRGDAHSNWGAVDGYRNTIYYAVLPDGMIIRYFANSDCNSEHGDTEILKSICGEFSVDINGNKLPNQTGKDVFYFFIAKQGVIPAGTKDETRRWSNFSDECVATTAGGVGCTAWVVYNENMDYLHCRDLSWTGKHSCKEK